MKVEHYRSRRKNVFAIICICFFWLVLCCICDCEWNWNWRWWKSTCVSTRYYRVTFVIVLLISRAELGNAFWGLFWPYATYRQASTSQFLSIWLSDICQPGSLSGFEFLLNMLWRQNSCSQHSFGLAPPPPLLELSTHGLRSTALFCLGFVLQHPDSHWLLISWDDVTLMAITLTKVFWALFLFNPSADRWAGLGLCYSCFNKRVCISPRGQNPFREDD